MIIVTGGAGFIGSNLVKGLNDIGCNEIIIVDDLTDGQKFKNLLDCKFLDYIDKDHFIQRVKTNETFSEHIDAIFHEGACVMTTEWNGRFMIENNYEYSKVLLHYSLERKIPFLYASSAAVYGASEICRESPSFEKPLNVYGYSKLLFDNYVRQISSQANSQILGLRYFNVYGPNETHKGPMKSVVQHFIDELQQTGKITIFTELEGVKPGEQRRDFIHVRDVVAMNLWFMQHPERSGIFNAGTGKSETFNDVARAIIQHYGHGNIEYIPIPKTLRDYYQVKTEADLTLLKSTGYQCTFEPLMDGVFA